MPLNLILRQNFSENAKVDSTLVSIKLFSNFQPLCDFNGSGTIPPGFNRGFFFSCRSEFSSGFMWLDHVTNPYLYPDIHSKMIPYFLRSVGHLLKRKWFSSSILFCWNVCFFSSSGNIQLWFKRWGNDVWCWNRNVTIMPILYLKPNT